MRYQLLFLFAVGALSSCTTVRLAGTFNETRPNAVLFVSRTIRLAPDGQMVFLQNSDVVGGGKHARGTYRLTARRLTLRVTGPLEMPVAHVEVRPLPATLAPDQLVVRVFSNQLDEPPQPWALATVLLYDAAGTIIGAVSCDENGRAVLPLHPPERPYRIGVQGFGAPIWQQSWPTAAATYDVFLTPNIGPPLPTGTIIRFPVLRVAPDQLLLRQKADTLMMVRQP